MRVVGCFLEYQGKFLLLYRHAHKPDGNTWCVPGGKVEPGETDLEALKREVYEETGYEIQDAEATLLGAFDFVSPRDETFTFVTYQVKLNNSHDVVLEEAAHSKFRWFTAEEAAKRDDLIHALPELLRLVGKI